MAKTGKPKEKEVEPQEPQGSELDPREEAISNLCNSVKTILSSTDTNELDSLHDVGTKILDANGQDIYGPNLTKEIAKRLNTYRQKIQFSIRLAQAYDEAAIDELRSYRTKEDQPYVWSSTSVRFLLRVKDESQRASLAKECAENNWPCRKLGAEVNSLTSGGPAKAAKGPGADLTSSLEALLRFYTTWADFVNLQASPNTNIYDKIQTIGEGHVTEKQRGLISRIITMSPSFTEKVCEMNGYLNQIQLSEK